MTLRNNSALTPGPTRGGFRGYIVPGPGFRGPGRVEVVALSLFLRPILGEDLFIFGLHLILGKK